MKDFKDNTRERSDKEVVRRLLTYAKPYKREFIWIIVMMIISLGIQLLPPLLIGLTVDTVGNDALSPQEKIEFMVFLSIFFVIVLVIGNVVGYLQGIMLQKVGQKTVVSLRDEVFNHIENLSIGQINTVPVGKLVTRVVNDTNTISEMYTNVLVNLVRNVLYLFAILVVIFIINWKISLFVVMVVPLVFLATFVFRKYSRTSYRRVRQNVSEVNAFLSENLSGMKVTQIFNQEDKKRNEFKDHSTKLRNSYLQEILVFGIYRPVVYMLSMVGLLLVLYIGYQEVLAGIITAGILYSYYAYVGDFFEPIQQLAEQFNTLQNAFASAEKVFDVLDTKPDIIDDAEAIELKTFSGQIEFKDVWFSYLPDEWVLK